jgi:uncharacterized protein YyaL (SSP411 family)
MRTTTNLLFVVLLVVLQACSGGDSRVYGRKYDPARNPAEDLKLAVADAQKENKRILLVVGGDWCKWCHVLDSFLKTNKEIKQPFNEVFIVMKVNMSPENRNQEFLAPFSETYTYPFFVILNKNGREIGAYNPGVLEDNNSYSVAGFKAFIEKFRPKMS